LAGSNAATLISALHQRAQRASKADYCIRCM
jgi:hypothetical protein